MTILDAMQDPALFAPWFSGPSWASWRAFLAALFALPLEAAELRTYRRCTARRKRPKAPAREAWVIAGRRGGKSRIAALLAVFIAAFRDHRAHLAPGETAVVMVIAADRRQARVVHRYARALLHGVPMLRKMVTGETRETIELSNGAAIEIHTSNFRSVRGYSAAAVIADECAFWPTDEAGANPDVETINALRPALATLPGALLLAISSPYSRRGALWEAFRRHHGQDGDPVLVWQADTRTMNPTVDEHVIADAYEGDPDAAKAEWGAEFRSDLENFVTVEAVEAVIVPDRRELPAIESTRHFGFVDPSGGSQDSMTLAVAHYDRENAAAVLDCVRERTPPFSPDAVVREFVQTLRSYRVKEVVGDRYAGEWPREKFREHGVTYTPAPMSASEFYVELLPLINSTRVELLDLPKLTAQLSALERRTTRSGKDSISHPPRGHDDVINSAAGALVLAYRDGTTVEEKKVLCW
jgi:Terminase large subunit, T4likevirus-type, N-terminal